MQIHEITQRRTSQVDEGIGSAIGGALGKGIGAVKKAGTAVASPFRDAAAGYRGGKVDAQTNAVADKAYRAWSTYRQQLDKSAPNGKADPAMVEKQLLAFVSKNLLGGQYLPNLINKDQVIKLVKQIAGSNVATQAPQKNALPANNIDATKTNATQTAADAGQPAVPAKPGTVEKGAEVTLGDKNYRWLGAQWAEVNPSNGKTGKTAEKGIVPQLNKQAAAGQFAKPQTGAGANVFGQMATTLGAKPTTTPANTMANTPVSKVNTASTTTTAPATTAPGVRMGDVPKERTPGATNEPITIGGKKLDPKFPGDAKTIANLKASGQLQEALQPAQELELFKKLVATAAQAQTEISTGASSAGSGSNVGNTNKKVQDPKQLVGAVTQAIGSTVDAGKLKAAGDAIRKNFQIDASIGSTADDAVDALLIAMGFQPA